MTWTVVVPVKRLDGAKTRLDVSVLSSQPRVRADLALAFALDTVAAALAAHQVGTVVVVSAEPRLLDAVRGWAGVRVVADPGGGLNAALVAGSAAAGDGPVALLPGDLPALRPADLDRALAMAGESTRAVVVDADGGGTTLLTARSAAGLDPRFGPGSAVAHLAAGHTRLDDVDERLRRDVDTAQDLVVAAELGLGPATAAVLGRDDHAERAVS